MKITKEETMKLHGFSNEAYFLTHFYLRDEMPAMCSHKCIVEIDGRCEHGCDSVFNDLIDSV